MVVKVNSSGVLSLITLRHENPEHFFTTQWTKTVRKSIWFLLFRWILAAFFIGTLAYSWTSSISKGYFGFWFIYMTNLNLLLSTLTTTYAAVLVSLYHFDAITVEPRSTSYKLYWFLSNVSTVFAFIITIVYWTVLFNGEWIGVKAFISLLIKSASYLSGKTSTLDVLVHGANSAAMLIELLITRHQFNFFHFIYPIFGGLIYFAFTIIYFVAGGVDSVGNRYIYYVINWEEPGRALSVAIGVMVLGIFMHIFSCIVQRLRRRVHKRIFKIKSVTITNSIHQTV
jgi:hypothetical protein